MQVVGFCIMTPYCLVGDTIVSAENLLPRSSTGHSERIRVHHITQCQCREPQCKSSTFRASDPSVLMKLGEWCSTNM